VPPDEPHEDVLVEHHVTVRNPWPAKKRVLRFSHLARLSWVNHLMEDQ
jgi:hypothetical protein